MANKELQSLTKGELLFSIGLLKVVKNQLKADRQTDIYTACRNYYVRVRGFYYALTVMIAVLRSKEDRLPEKDLVEHMWANRTPIDHSHNYATQTIVVRRNIYLKKLQWLNNTLTAVRKELKARGYNESI